MSLCIETVSHFLALILPGRRATSLAWGFTGAYNALNACKIQAGGSAHLRRHTGHNHAVGDSGSKGFAQAANLARGRVVRPHLLRVRLLLVLQELAGLADGCKQRLPGRSGGSISGFP